MAKSCTFIGIVPHNIYWDFNVKYRGYYMVARRFMLFAGWEVRIVKNCDRGLENAARGRRSQFFTIRTEPI